MLNEFTPAHPYAELFPLHNEGPEFFAFSDDIKEHGQREKIVMFDDKVLDGRRRERACRRAGVEPKYTEFKGTEEQALAFVISKNLHRRHLGEGERALIAGRIITAKKGRPTVYEKTDNSAVGAIIEKPLTVGKAAEMLNVSDDDAKKGKKIVEKGTEELQKAVADGTLSVTDAAKVASEPAKVQDAAVKKVRGKKAKTAAAAVEPDDEDDGAILDDDGNIVPANLRQVFCDTNLFRSAAAMSAKAAIALRKAEETLAYAAADKQAANEKAGDRRVYSTSCRAAENKMRNVRPCRVCECGGSGCKKCGDKGYLTVDEVADEK